MQYRIILILTLLVISPTLLFSAPTDDYLVEFGAELVEVGRYDEAKIEFKKALIINPGNKKAQDYLAKIHHDRVNDVLDSVSKDISFKPKPIKPATVEVKMPESSQEVILRKKPLDVAEANTFEPVKLVKEVKLPVEARIKELEPASGPEIQLAKVEDSSQEIVEVPAVKGADLVPVGLGAKWELRDESSSKGFLSQSNEIRAEYFELTLDSGIVYISVYQ